MFKVLSLNKLIPHLHHLSNHLFFKIPDLLVTFQNLRLKDRLMWGHQLIISFLISFTITFDYFLNTLKYILFISMVLSSPENMILRTHF